MAAAERRRGRRDNGLDATDWRAIDDLDPRLSEPVLDLLAVQGIAAYVQPAIDVDPITRNATLPNRPHDRLFVDRRALPAARESLRRFLRTEGVAGTGPDPAGPDPAGPDPSAGAGPAVGAGVGSGPPTGSAAGAATSDVDATFAEIVSRIEVAPADRTPADPTADTTFEGPRDDPPDPSTPAPARTGPVDGRHLTEPSLLDALDTFGADLPDLPEDQSAERFEPPPPPPLPRLSSQSVLGALAIVAGLVLIIGAPDFLPLDRSSTMLLGFATMLGGATALILRLRSGTDPDDTPTDDGAQV